MFLFFYNAVGRRYMDYIAHLGGDAFFFPDYVRRLLLRGEKVAASCFKVCSYTCAFDTPYHNVYQVPGVQVFL